jgi:hypothetical protein
MRLGLFDERAVKFYNPKLVLKECGHKDLIP